jgi:hypothetical protein
MNGRKVVILELFVGIILLVVAMIIYWWISQIYWIAVYPQPFRKQVLYVLPYTVAGLGIVLILDAARRWVSRRSERKAND